MSRFGKGQRTCGLQVASDFHHTTGFQSRQPVNSLLAKVPQSAVISTPASNRQGTARASILCVVSRPITGSTTATTITSRGNRKPANTEELPDDVTEPVACLMAMVAPG